MLILVVVVHLLFVLAYRIATGESVRVVAFATFPRETVVLL